MLIEQLDLETRSKIYSYTKKVLRKYQKGITTGKLTADKFADNILSDDSISDILDNKLLADEDFKVSYISYIDTLIGIQNESLSKSKKKRIDTTTNNKPTIPQKIQFKNLLESSGYNLLIPYQYLTAIDVDNITQYITTGSIDLGNERVYNYVHKNTLQ
ncbi:hypothetical protein CHL78_005160 [Romboutsia weinsteinii]|uniref:Uncharacterized protein n=1 Tax=Romboutsia weinsteinii TaxID=2020949 RepID=A0A371J7C4_9FIRM|nr:hypothetical protein [Romboutsia weinsteinii]RDY28578.1 hypothetical protein CHL78_005160 [Romboutsia weinsteinii]